MEREMCPGTADSGATLPLSIMRKKDMKLKGSPGMRIVDANTNEDAGVFDSEGRPRMKPEYVLKRLSARRKIGSYLQERGDGA